MTLHLLKKIPRKTQKPEATKQGSSLRNKAANTVQDNINYKAAVAAFEKVQFTAKTAAATKAKADKPKLDAGNAFGRGAHAKKRTARETCTETEKKTASKLLNKEVPFKRKDKTTKVAGK